MPKEWMKVLPEELQNEPTIQNFESVADVVKGYKEATVKISRKGVIVPPEGTKDDAPEMAEFYKSLGRPEKPEEYDLPANLLVLPNGQKVPQEAVDEFRKMAHGLGMTKKQFQKAFGWRIEKTIKEAEAANAAALKDRQETETALRAKFGAKYNERIQGIQKLISAYGEGATQEDINDTLKRPGMVNLLSNILDNLSEATLEQLGHVRGGELTPDEAKEEIHRIRTDKDHPLNAAFLNPKLGEKHKEARARVEKLYEMAHPGKKKI